ncbi:MULTISPECIES: hypothetical protein [unclassified Paenibacillus]|uniref:hypothetical protein n=1 Tax=unclassified Paenibacillus TaxID=185978 RepID=UPI0027D7C4B3|nr:MULTISPECIES: hypothetical protein [unclassified Paenibacillus]
MKKWFWLIFLIVVLIIAYTIVFGFSLYMLPFILIFAGIAFLKILNFIEGSKQNDSDEYYRSLERINRKR